LRRYILVNSANLRKEVRVITRIKQAIKRVFKRNAKAQ
jgi:hypothetical protein